MSNQYKKGKVTFSLVKVVTEPITGFKMFWLHDGSRVLVVGEKVFKKDFEEMK